MKSQGETQEQQREFYVVSRGLFPEIPLANSLTKNDQREIEGK